MSDLALAPAAAGAAGCSPESTTSIDPLAPAGGAAGCSPLSTTSIDPLAPAGSVDALELADGGPALALAPALVLAMSPAPLPARGGSGGFSSRSRSEDTANHDTEKKRATRFSATSRR
jgi:hypothetical protein